ncbi:hypothetical protein KQ310_11855 [Synechococcus sp. CS-1328]|nr:hypothetical protein [Synechococcus sp. CS-1328]
MTTMRLVESWLMAAFGVDGLDWAQLFFSAGLPQPCSYSLPVMQLHQPALDRC